MGTIGELRVRQEAITALLNEDHARVAALERRAEDIEGLGLSNGELAQAAERLWDAGTGIVDRLIEQPTDDETFHTVATEPGPYSQVGICASIFTHLESYKGRDITVKGLGMITVEAAHKSIGEKKYADRRVAFRRSDVYGYGGEVFLPAQVVHFEGGEGHTRDAAMIAEFRGYLVEFDPNDISAYQVAALEEQVDNLAHIAEAGGLRVEDIPTLARA